MIRVSQVSKRFDATSVLSEVSFELGAAEVLALLGPSGCGKTTLLRVIAGLEHADSGEVFLGDTQLSGRHVHLPPERRDIGLVFQDFALFPHLSVAQNLAFGLRKRSREEQHAIVEAQLERFDLQGLGPRYPHELSGGQQQRVALARALAPSPRVLLMDEPFSNLDTALRRRLRVELRSLLKSVGIATIFVTHDQAEALSLADRVAVLEKGQIAQLDVPERLYLYPKTRAVALATGQVLSIPCVARDKVVHCPLGSLPGEGPDGEVELLLRPEQLQIGPAGEGAQALVRGRDYTGAELELLLDMSGLSLSVRIALGGMAPFIPEIGSEISVHVQGPVHWIAR